MSSNSSTPYTQQPGSAMPQDPTPAQPQAPTGYVQQSSPAQNPNASAQPPVYASQATYAQQPMYGQPPAPNVVTALQVSQIRTNSIFCLILGILWIVPFGLLTSIIALV